MKFLLTKGVNMKIYSYKILYGTFLLLCYQNFSFVDWSPHQLATINNSIRERHAKELLGKTYSKMNQELKKTGVKSKLSLQSRIFTLVKENVPEKYIPEAHEITQTILEESQNYKFDPLFVLAVIQTESKFNPEIKGSHGEIGLMQIKPDTAKWIAQKSNFVFLNESDLFDPRKNIKIGVKYMSYLRKEFDSHPNLYITAYNMGPEKLKELKSKNTSPKEYHDRVIENYKHIWTLLNDRGRKIKVALNDLN